jgi:hypothetical protein
LHLTGLNPAFNLINSKLDLTNSVSLIFSADQVDTLFEYIDHATFNNVVSFPSNELIIVDYYRYANCQELVNFLVKYEIKCKVYLVIQYQNQKVEIENILNYFKLSNVQVIAYDFWMYKTYIENNSTKIDNIPNKKFSLFSRRYQVERFNFFTDLFFNDVIGNCHYTLTNFHPDTMIKEDKENLFKNLNEQYKTHPKFHEFKIWVDNLPYVFAENIHDPFANSTYRYIEKSDIHISIETMQVFTFVSPVILTEKTYKPILCKKPFLILGVPNSLSLLRQNGFKTFHPFINEEYDTIDDFNERKKALVSELKRLNAMPENEFNYILEKCKETVDYNYDLFIRKVESKLFADWGA